MMEPRKLPCSLFVLISQRRACHFIWPARTQRDKPCAAIAHQFWYRLRADEFCQGNAPSVPSADVIHDIEQLREIDQDQKNRLIDYIKRSRSGSVFLDEGTHENSYVHVGNLWLSKCFSCNEISVWVHDRLLFPDYN